MTRSNNDNQLTNLTSLTFLIQSLLSEVRDSSNASALIQQRLETMADDIDVLSHIVRDGNGQKSILTRLALLEQELKDVAEHLKTLKQVADDVIVSKIKSDEEELANKRKFKREKMINLLLLLTAIGPGVFAFIMWLVGGK